MCSGKPFQKLFDASGKNEWEARHAVRTACNAETSAMFCEDSAIHCEKYE
jgi:putative periplasmic protein